MVTLTHVVLLGLYIASRSLSDEASSIVASYRVRSMLVTGRAIDRHDATKEPLKHRCDIHMRHSTWSRTPDTVLVSCRCDGQQAGRASMLLDRWR